MRKILLVVLVNLLLFVVLLGLVEGAARLFFADDLEAIFPDRYGDRPDIAFVSEHDVRGTALSPGYDDGFHRIGAAGFRGPDPDPNFAGKTILALGDSTTFGWGVPEGEDYPSRLRELLPDTEVINAGVPGYTSMQVRLYLEEILDEGVEPDLLLVSILWNDLWYSSITNWRPDVLVYAKPGGLKNILMRESALFRTAMIYNMKTDLVDIFNEEAYRVYLDSIDQMIEIARERDIEIVLFEPPFAAGHMPSAGLNRFHVRYTRDFFFDLARRHTEGVRESAAKKGVRVIDHRVAFGRDVPEDLFLDPLHPTTEGNLMLAEDLAAAIRPFGQ